MSALLARAPCVTAASGCVDFAKPLQAKLGEFRIRVPFCQPPPRFSFHLYISGVVSQRARDTAEGRWNGSSRDPWRYFLSTFGLGSTPGARSTGHPSGWRGDPRSPEPPTMTPVGGSFSCVFVCQNADAHGETDPVERTEDTPLR